MKVSTTHRVAAKGVDLLISIALGAVLPNPLGPVLGFVYALIADGIELPFFRGRSLGKQLFRLRVVNVQTRKGARLKASVLRNLPIGVPLFFAVIPFAGWILAFLVGVPLFAMELYLIRTKEQGRRLGDLLGETEVIRT